MKSSIGLCILASSVLSPCASRVRNSKTSARTSRQKLTLLVNDLGKEAYADFGDQTKGRQQFLEVPLKHHSAGSLAFWIFVPTAILLVIGLVAAKIASKAGVCCFRDVSNQAKEIEKEGQRFEKASESSAYFQSQSHGKEDTEAVMQRNINEELVQLALPNIISNMSTPLIGLVDSFVAGHMGSEVLNAVAVGVATFNLLYNTFMFLRKSTTGLAAQANGARNFAEVRATAARSIGVGFLLGLLLLILRGPLMTLIFSWQKPPEYAYNECVQYYNARMWGAPLALANFAIQGFLNGMKRSRQVLCQQITLNVANVVFCLLLASSVGPFQLGAAGIGYAASLANLIAFFNGMGQVWTCLHGGFGSEPLPGEWELRQIFKCEPLKEMFANAGAVTLRSVCLTCTQATLTAIAARLTTKDHPYLAANLLLMQLHMLFAMGSDGFSNAAEALVGEAIGRKDVKRMYAVVIAACKWGLGIACFFSLLWFSSGEFFFEQMTDASNRESSNEATNYLLWLVFGQPLAVWAFLMDGFFVGATLAKEMLYSMVFAAVGFVITIYVLVGKAIDFPQFGPLPLNAGNNGLWLSFYCFLVYRSLGLLAQWKSMDRKCAPAMLINDGS